MRKNKKLLLGGLSVLTLVAAGSGAVSTFAWFQATEARVNLTADGSNEATLSTTASAAVSDVSAVLNFDITLPTSTLQPTNATDGKIYVIQNGKVVLSTTQDESKRIASDGTVNLAATPITYSAGGAISNEDAANLNGRIFKVTISSAAGAGGIRIADNITAAAGDNLTKIVNEDVDIGYVVITADGSSAPVLTKKNAAGSGTAFSSFYYSYNPEHGEAVGSAATADEAGSKTITLTAALTEVDELPA